MIIEIAVLLRLGKKIDVLARERGRWANLYVVLFVVLWFLGEVGGGLVCWAIEVFLLGGSARDLEALPLYIFALVGGSLGAYTAFKIANRGPLEIALPDDGVDET